MARRAHRGDGVLILVGLFKLVKALVLLALGLAIAFAHRDLAGHLRGLGHAVGVRSAHVDAVVGKLAAMDPHRLAAFGFGSLVYGALFAVEGLGLVRRKVWAEYMTTVITISFIPLEIAELISGRSIVKGIVIALNVAVVVYLILRLRRDEHWPFATARS